MKKDIEVEEKLTKNTAEKAVKTKDMSKETKDSKSTKEIKPEKTATKEVKVVANDQVISEPVVSLEEKLKGIRPEYKRMLNNLLGIGHMDNAVVASSKTTNFDLSKLATPEEIQKIYENKDFKVEIDKDEEGKGDVILYLEDAKNAEEFLNIVDQNGLFVSMANRAALKKDFKPTQAKLVEVFKVEKNTKIAKWQRTRTLYLDKQIQSNSWSFYVGTYFLQLRTETTTLYAPLVLKKATIEITTADKIILSTIDGSVEINEKLLFFLKNEFRFELPTLPDDQEYSFKEIADLFNPVFKELTHKEYKFQPEFEPREKDSIKSPTLDYAPGIALMVVQPSGGGLRDKLIEVLVREGNLDKILDINPLRNVKREVDEILEKNKSSLFRITQTDISQEKAIQAAMLDSVIIWGPPGTGKSQTLSNILANLLYQDKSVIVTSEKKAALDVIQTRMGKISKFMFFGLTDKNIGKESFYKPFKELFKLITEINKIIPFNKTTPIFADEEKMFYKQHELLHKEHIPSVAKFVKYFENDPNNKVTQKLKKYLISNHELILDFEKEIRVAIENKSTAQALAMVSGKEVKILSEIFDSVENNWELLEYTLGIKNLANIERFWQLWAVENAFINHKYEFMNDEDHLELFLAHKMRDKMLYLQHTEEWRDKINEFIKNMSSAFRVPHKFISMYSDVIKKLYSIFVSTPQTLASIIDMNKTYDFAIFDEASQMHLEKALPFISIANKSIIAGDNQQMQPTSYFAIRDTAEILEESEDTAASLLDYAYRKGLQGTREFMLTKNYRSSAAELMMFSSKHFYKSSLDTINSFSHQNGTAIEVHHVNGKWEQRVNEVEANAALSYVVENAQNYRSIILLTLNASQQQFVESLIYNNPNYKNAFKMLENDVLKIRNLENIQGDEADLVVITVAYDMNAALGSTYVARPEGRNALNVAISRARDKMVIFKSIKSDEVKIGGDKNESLVTFKDWLEYLDMNVEQRLNIIDSKFVVPGQEKQAPKLSELASDVIATMKKTVAAKKSLEVSVGHNIGTYKIDVALVDPKTKYILLCLEINNYKSVNIDVMIKDIERNRFISSKGYPMLKITECDWWANKDKILNKVEKIID